jgi:hypothetical protein
MIQCEQCELCEKGPDGRKLFKCDPFSNVKEASFRPPGGRLVKLHRRPALRHLLEQLVAQHQRARGLATTVDDLFEAYRVLGERGVPFTRPIGEEDWGWYAHFYDPEGNRLQIYQNKPGFE